MTRRDHAVALAARGFAVFPIIAGGKTPLAKGWRESASRCPMSAWDEWTRPDLSSAEYNIGIRGDTCVLLDVDVPGESHSIDGMASLAALGWTGKTLTVATPSGGKHLYFRKPEGRDYGQTDLAPGINVRSSGGYVVGPGSWTKHIPGKQAQGFYTIVEDCEPAPLPQCLERHLTLAGAVARYNESSFEGEWNHPYSLEWCYRYIREWAPSAVKGSRGRTGLEIAHVLGDRAILKPTALEMLQEWHENKCDPPDDDENQMEHVLDSAYSSRQKPFGCDCAHMFAEAIELPKSLAPTPAPAPTIVVNEQTPFDELVVKSRVTCEADIAKIPPIPWLVKGKLIRGAITGLVSPPGVGKSTLSLQWACALAVGDGSFTALRKLENAAPVQSLVIGIEDTIEIMEMRLATMCKAFGLSFAEVRERVHLYSGLSARPVRLMEKKDKRSMLTLANDLVRLQHYVHKHGIEAVFVDPLVEVHDGEENDNGEMRRVMGALRSLAVTTNAAVTVIHHTRKPPQASSDGYAGDQFAGRGASSIPAAFRISFTLFGMGAKDAERCGVAADMQHMYIRLDDSKTNWSAMGYEPQWFMRQAYDLANGENVAVLKPHAFAAGDDRAAEMMAEEIAGFMAVGCEASLASVAAALLARPPYKDKSERTLRRRVREVLSAGSVKTSRGLLTFTASGREGGTLTLTEK